MSVTVHIPQGGAESNILEVKEVYKHNCVNEGDLLNWAGLGCEIEAYEPMEKGILENSSKHGIY